MASLKPDSVKKPVAVLKTVQARRIGPVLAPDFSRVLIRPFFPDKRDIALRIIARVLEYTDQEALELLTGILTDFADRHERVEKTLLKRYHQAMIRYETEIPPESSMVRKALIGSYFTHEYSPESAALFNPSIVAHPDQSGVPEGSLRFVLSLRATGEGHISSITFRTGIISPQNQITMTPTIPIVVLPETDLNTYYQKALFARKLTEAGLHNHFCRRVVDRLPDEFLLEELRDIIKQVRKKMTPMDTMADRSAQGILLLAESNHQVSFPHESRLSQRVLFPSVPSMSNGIEDARFVRFVDEDGTVTYYATYTAYDGRITMPQLLETGDFLSFKFITLNGPAVQNKGMALFPRKINGRYVMLSRQDDENILLMDSDNIHFWQNPKILLRPEEPWEIFKIGTCGSPIETKAGWLVLSHGVGPMRKYCIGAFLLDLNDPSKVLGRLRTPLISPNEEEREGYVPNVVYTCGAMLHQNELIIPYAMSDYSSNFATAVLDEVLEAMS